MLITVYLGFAEDIVVQLTYGLLLVFFVFGAVILGTEYTRANVSFVPSRWFRWATFALCLAWGWLLYIASLKGLGQNVAILVGAEALFLVAFSIAFYLNTRKGQLSVQLASNFSIASLIEGKTEKLRKPYAGGKRLFVAYLAFSALVIAAAYLSLMPFYTKVSTFFVFGPVFVALYIFGIAVDKDHPSKEEEVPHIWWWSTTIGTCVALAWRIFGLTERALGNDIGLVLILWAVIAAPAFWNVIRAPRDKADPSRPDILYWSNGFRLLLVLFGIGIGLLLSASVPLNHQSAHSARAVATNGMPTICIVLYLIAVACMFLYPGRILAWSSFATAFLLPYCLVISLEGQGMLQLAAVSFALVLAVLCAYLLLTLVQQVLIEEWKTQHTDVLSISSNS